MTEFKFGCSASVHAVLAFFFVTLGCLFSVMVGSSAVKDVEQGKRQTPACSSSLLAFALVQSSSDRL